MALFLSTYTNKIDRKGRISVPAAFRAALAANAAAGAVDGGDAGVVLFRSHVYPCLEGFSLSVMEELSARLDHFDLFSPAQDDLATMIFGDAVQLAIDSDGRIVLPPALVDFAGLQEQASFVGMGRKFQVWHPDAFADRQKFAREQVRAQGLTIPRAMSGGTL